MKKQKALILEIPKPCTESWAEMTPMGLGRFCTHCQKTVTDITQMSDTQVVQLFQKNTDTHCIRAFASQLNRPIRLPAQEPTRFYRIAVALGLTLVMATAADTYSRPRPPLVEQNYLLNEGDTTKKETLGADTISIRGVVLDETNNPLPGVIVKVKQGGLLKGGTVTEDDGSFEIKLRKSNNFFAQVPLNQNDTYDLIFIANGYEESSIILDKNNLKVNFTIGMNCNLGQNIRSYKIRNNDKKSQAKSSLEDEIITMGGRSGGPSPLLNLNSNSQSTIGNSFPQPLIIDTTDIPKYEVPKKNFEINKNKTYNEKDLKNFGL